jgi:hypothetical protein
MFTINCLRACVLTVAGASPLFWLPEPAAAQTLYGSLVGNVFDTTEAAIPDAVPPQLEMERAFCR